ncbi:MAG: hypothetical protein M5R38_07200 [Candidatus Methylomirabilis sp.]|nr:hypothetical protein [Candidatus Methylomirabilis sp.]
MVSGLQPRRTPPVCCLWSQRRRIGDRCGCREGHRHRPGG